MRFEGTCYRAHDPRWSFKPMSGAGAAAHGGRFNPKGLEALYLGLTLITAIKEANQGFAFKIEPYVICSYDVDCTDLVDLRTEVGRKSYAIDLAAMDCPWFEEAARGNEPASWRLAKRLIAEGNAGALVPSFAPGASVDDHNLVLWDWSRSPPHKVLVFDPSGRLPKDQLSWD